MSGTGPECPEMETRKIGRIDFAPGVLALGCWAFGGAQWGGQEDADSIDAIETALACGITHFDTAQAYGGGRSETLCGEHLKAVREKVFIATKSAAATKEAMFEQIDTSLERLGTDAIDLFYVHWPHKGVDLRPEMEALAEAREAGKIRGVGVSNFSIEDMARALEVGPIDAHQLCYNLFWRWDEADIIPFCQEHGIAVVTYSSIAQGILTGKFLREPQFKEGDSRPGTVLFEPEVWPHVYEGVEALKKLAEQAGRPLTELAIRWVAAQPGITSVLVGARNGEQVRRNVAAMAGEIDPGALDRMTAVADEVLKHVPDVSNLWRYYP